MPHVTPKMLDRAVSDGIITPAQAEKLLHHFMEQADEPVASGPAFTFTNVLYYFGGMLAIGAMSLFMTLGWSQFGGWAVFTIALCYAAISLALSRYFLDRALLIPAGILAALAITLVPLAIYGAQEALGYWPINRPYRDYHYWVDWRWATMELATLLVGTVVLYFFRLPFALMPISVTLWYMSMDFAPLLAGGNDADLTYRKAVSMAFGVLMIAVAISVDVRSRRRPDYGFWFYLFGTLAFWGALSMSDSASQVGKFFYAALNVGLIFLGAVLDRRIFTVCGGLGVFGYLSYLSYSVFKDSLMFPFALTLLGLALVVAGVWWQKREKHFRQQMRALLPASLRQAIENAE